MKVYLLYSGNVWLENTSLQLHAVCSTFEKACELANIDSQEYDPLTEENCDELKSNRSTFGRDTNYLICEVTMDELDS